MQGFRAEIAARMAGLDVQFSNATYSGLRARCVSVTASGQPYKWCVAQAGILAYASSSGSTFQLTSYSSNVSSAGFNLAGRGDGHDFSLNTTRERRGDDLLCLGQAGRIEGRRLPLSALIGQARRPSQGEQLPTAPVVSSVAVVH